MALSNITDVAKAISPELVQRIEFIITILQAAGIILLLYIIYNVFIGILEWKNKRRIKEIHGKIADIDERLKSIEDKLE